MRSVLFSLYAHDRKLPEMLIKLTLLFILTITVTVFAQEQKVSVLTNKDIVSLVKAGISSDVIIGKIKRSRCQFDTDASVLADLKREGVGNEVLKAMVEAPDSVSPQTIPGPQGNARVTAPSAADTTPQMVMCGQERVKMPEVRGFRLGQTFQEISARFANNRTYPFGKYGRADGIGFRRERLTVYEVDQAEEERLKDIDSVELEFLDDRLVSFVINYGRSVKWDNDLEFTATVANLLGLPAKGWRDRSNPTLDCE